ncbi:helix-turn-helix domain-containing protein [Streptomyces sp. NPDC048342]
MRRVLGPLQDSGPSGALAQTLTCLAAHGFDRAAAAAALPAHRNALLYRINRIEKLCGLDLDRHAHRELARLAVVLVQTAGAADQGACASLPRYRPSPAAQLDASVRAPNIRAASWPRAQRGPCDLVRQRGRPDPGSRPRTSGRRTTWLLHPTRSSAGSRTPQQVGPPRMLPRPVRIPRHQDQSAAAPGSDHVRRRPDSGGPGETSRAHRQKPFAGTGP